MARRSGRTAPTESKRKQTHRRQAPTKPGVALRRLYTRVINGLRIAAVASIALAIVFVALGFHSVVLERIAPDQANAAPKTEQTQQSIPIAAQRTDQSCGTSLQTDAQFAKCPDFITIYTNRQSGSINPDLFNAYVGPAFANNEAQYYTNDQANLRIEQGSLRLQAQAQAYGGMQYTSARIDTKGKEDFLYGKLIVRAKLPIGAGTWPAIWMLPSQPRYANNAPSSSRSSSVNDGEIDIAESIGLEPHVVYGVAHSYAYPEDGPDRSYFSTVTVPDNDQAFHDYEVDWTPTSLNFLVDGQSFYTYTKKADADWRSWPFDQPFYLIINLALGGTWAGRDTIDYPGDGIDKRVLPTALQVQSIRYYTYTSKSPVLNR